MESSFYACESSRGRMRGSRCRAEEDAARSRGSLPAPGGRDAVGRRPGLSGGSTTTTPPSPAGRSAPAADAAYSVPRWLSAHEDSIPLQTSSSYFLNLCSGFHVVVLLF